VAIVIPMFAHFLNNLHTLQIIAERQQHNIHISKRVRDDLILSRDFLGKASTGVSMNLITFRVPDKVYINDASEHGLGGLRIMVGHGDGVYLQNYKDAPILTCLNLSPNSSVFGSIF
jgi:hypothetical protein